MENLNQSDDLLEISNLPDLKIISNASLRHLNTFGFDAHADFLVKVGSVSALQKALNSRFFKSKSLLSIGKGSNLLFVKDFQGIVLHSAIQFIKVLKSVDNQIWVEAGSGVDWDDFVAYCVKQAWCGVENLSFIPGEIGAAAVQNIGAYGMEVGDVIESVTAIEIETGIVRTFLNAECKYGYRNSIFKTDLKGKYFVTSVIFKLNTASVFNLTYQHLENEVLKTGEINLANIRKTIISIRQDKLPDPNVVGNAGSFFMNPVISTLHFEEIQTNFPEIPNYRLPNEEVKIPAAWLIEQCGWKGKKIGHVAVYEKQPLVLLNLGEALPIDIIHLAQQIQLSVNEKFGIKLNLEVNYIE
jgi:UDP-N-acetylmuramate dehydrogenase